MSYPEEFHIPFEDYQHDGVWIRIVDVAALLPRHATATYADRPVRRIRKVLIHHHAGSVSPTSGTKPNGQSYKDAQGIPLKLINAANFFINAPPGGRGWPGYAYHYDIPYHDEIVDGRRVVYRVQAEDRNSYHTGAGQNETGVGISFIGSLRTIGMPRGQHATPNDGIPSEHQRASVRVLVHYLQRRHRIADCHIQGHFQHGKRACPGYDAERWIMEHEDRQRRFCYPVNLSGTTAPILDATTGRDARCAEYMRNSLVGRSGFFPFGRRFFWHGGVHLFPPAGQNSPVFCVRDGWVIAARPGGQVQIDGRDYGSNSFVLVQHSDPGLRNNNERGRSLINNDLVRQLEYYSLYMHLAPVTASSQIGWIQLLGQLHPQLRDAMFANPQQARRLDDLALAVKTGDRIGSVGRHDAFAARPTGTPDPSGGHQAVLHFEIFSPENLIQRFDPDAALHQQWTLTDTDRNALADNARRNLGRLTPFSTTAMRDRLDDLETDQAAADPRWFDPGEVFQTDAELHDLFSRVITRHVSEWAADWRTVLTRNRRAWGLTTEMINHGVSVADQFQWWNTIVPTGRGFRDHSALKVNRNTKPYYYHPIRLLNWLNGLQRVLDNPMGYAYSTNQAIDVDQDLRVSNPRYGWHWESRFLWTSRVL